MVSDQPRSGFDFFAAGALPSPTITAGEAERLVAEEFGLAVVARSLGSQQDANFLLSDPDGAPLGVLKVSNGAFGEVEIEAQDAGAAWVA